MYAQMTNFVQNKMTAKHCNNNNNSSSSSNNNNNNNNNNNGNGIRYGTRPAGRGGLETGGGVESVQTNRTNTNTYTNTYTNANTKTNTDNNGDNNNNTHCKKKQEIHRCTCQDHRSPSHLCI